MRSQKSSSVVGIRGGSKQTCTLWVPLEAQPSFTVTSLGSLSHLSSFLSRGWQNYLLHQSWGWANAPHRGLHFTQPAPLWPRRHCQSHWSISGMAVHHFVLLKVFDCPAQLSGAASAGSAISLHRWKCLALRAQTWASSFLCWLSWQSAEAEVRCVGYYVRCKRWPPRVRLCCSSQAEHRERSEDCASKYGAFKSPVLHSLQ